MPFSIGIADRRDARTTVRSAADLAHDLGIRLVAEGVETASDLATVTSLGCDVAQGYFIWRPGTAADIRA